MGERISVSWDKQTGTNLTELREFQYIKLGGYVLRKHCQITWCHFCKDMESVRRILVIGAGASGLAAIKSCKEESLEVICYEKTKNFGGRWRFSENSISGQSSVMKSTVHAWSKEIGAFSDFPPPKEFSNYLHHTKMLMYLTLYAQEFDIVRHIKYQREVIRIVPTSEYSSNGKWLVTSVNGFNNSEVSEEFDGVMVCTGRLSEPFIPNYPNQDTFKGIILHSQSLKNVTSVEDLKILVIGNGNSAIDVAVEASPIANQVYLSTRNGFWVFPKLGPKGLPFDMSFVRRDVQLLKSMCSDVVNHYVEKFLETKLNHDDCKIKPSYRAMDKCPTINDDLPDKILTGRIIIKGQISNFEKDGIFFEHEEELTQVDAVVFATGYTMKLPFLDNDIFRDSNGLPNLYKGVFPMDMKHSTLALIGFVESNGPLIPISESQSRWASRIFAKKLQIPTKSVMDSYKELKYSKIKENSNQLMEDYIQYMDELADEYGVKPNMCSLLFKDSSLFWACLTGPFLPYQYRLVGPKQLKNARELIMECGQRVKEPFNTRFSDKCSEKVEI